jgi:hypothetical protein
VPLLPQSRLQSVWRLQLKRRHLSKTRSRRKKARPSHKRRMSQSHLPLLRPNCPSRRSHHPQLLRQARPHLSQPQCRRPRPSRLRRRDRPRSRPLRRLRLRSRRPRRPRLRVRQPYLRRRPSRLRLPPRRPGRLLSPPRHLGRPRNLPMRRSCRSRRCPCHSRRSGSPKAGIRGLGSGVRSNVASQSLPLLCSRLPTPNPRPLGYLAISRDITRRWISLVPS